MVLYANNDDLLVGAAFSVPLFSRRAPKKDERFRSTRFRVRASRDF
jgi:hypothetical protein